MVQETLNGSWDGLSRSKTSKHYKVVSSHRFIDSEPSDDTWSLPSQKQASLMNGLVFPVE
ncbi:hypothetical protein NDI39_24090 [Microcoleus sp. ZQ-A2]|nr:hypothetical protein [Microcoleus sp. FACHB-1]